MNQEKTNRILATILSYLSVFTIGGYVCQTIKYHEPVELYRWILTSMFGMFFYLLSLPEKDKI